jgi:hypothetical protein
VSEKCRDKTIAARIATKEIPMSIELSAEQQRALNEATEFPPRLVHPRTGETYVLLHAELYERVRAILEDEDEIAAIRETYPLVNTVLDAGEAAESKESA